MAMRRRGEQTAEIPSIVRLWILRALVPLGGYKRFVRRHGFENDGLARDLGLEAWLDKEDEVNISPIRRELEKQYAAAEKEAAALQVPEPLRGNIAKLADVVGLSDTDCRLLEFTVMARQDEGLKVAANYAGELSSARLMGFLSHMLDLPENQVIESLSPRGLLTQAGLMSVDGSTSYCFESKIDLLSRGFPDMMSTLPIDVGSLLRDVVTQSATSKLAVSDYGHLAGFLDFTLSYLEEAQRARRRGVNILLYGPPGVGKSELARVMAAQLNCTLFEISSEDSDGDPVTGEKRLQSYRAAQCLFTKQDRVMLMFDEVEDVFNDGAFLLGKRSTAEKRKAWMNRMLEGNPIPTLWLSNAVQCMDPAFLRRFDIVKEMPIPPKKARTRIISEACAGLLDEPEIKRLAESKDLSPAVVARAASVVRSVSWKMDDRSAAGAVGMLIENSLQAQGLRAALRNDPTRLPELYDPAFINTDTDLEKLIAGLVRTRAGRLCLYGPPGTGKTALGRHLAERLDAPLHVAKVSDLVSPWVGMTEKHIAKAFREAEQEKAVLLIDEVDSFLQDRRSASRNWEATAVNEMLTQMESYPGLFVASTNLMDGLDQAALRRFDLKLRFHYLRSGQAVQLFRRHCKALGLRVSRESIAVVERLDMLAPGDFAAVVRQARFNAIETSQELARALEQECALKEGSSKRKMGFI